MDIALIGTGLMGGPMAERLLAAGHDLTVYNRTRDKALALREQGATVAATAQQAVTSADGTILMLTDAAAIRETLYPHGRPPELAGRTLIQMGTIAPRESKALQEDVQRAGGRYLEAPVLGSRPQAREGRLLVMVGATPQLFERWLDLLRCFGSDPLLIGPVGRAAALKLALNQLIAAQLTSFATALALVRHHEVDVQRFMTLLRQSAIYAPTFDSKLPRMLERSFGDPNFPLRLLKKDLDLVRAVAEDEGLDTALLDGLSRVVAHGLERGLGDSDYSAVYEAVDPD